MKTKVCCWSAPLTARIWCPWPMIFFPGERWGSRQVWSVWPEESEDEWRPVRWGGCFRYDQRWPVRWRNRGAGGDYTPTTWFWPGTGVNAESYTNGPGSCKCGSEHAWSETSSSSGAPERCQTETAHVRNADPASPGAWQAAAEGQSIASNQPVHEWTADAANPGAWQAATEGRNTAGNRPVHEWTADAANPGAWQAATEGRNTAGNRPLHGWTTDAANPGAWQAATEGRNTAGNRPLHGWTTDAANPRAWQAATEGRNTAGNRPVHEWTADAANPGPPPRAGTQPVTDRFMDELQGCHRSPRHSR